MCSAKTSIYVTSCLNWTFKGKVYVLCRVLCGTANKRIALLMVLFPAESSRWVRTVTDNEFDKFYQRIARTQHGRCLYSSPFANLFPTRKRTVCKYVLQIFQDKVHTILQQNSLVFLFSPIVTYHLYKFENDKPKTMSSF